MIFRLAPTTGRVDPPSVRVPPSMWTVSGSAPSDAPSAVLSSFTCNVTVLWPLVSPAEIATARSYPAGGAGLEGREMR